MMKQLKQTDERTDQDQQVCPDVQLTYFAILPLGGASSSKISANRRGSYSKRNRTSEPNNNVICVQ